MNKRDIVIYVAGPYSACEKYETQMNVLDAIDEGRQLRKAGYSVVIPHLESFLNEECLSESEWLEHGISLMRRCHAVLDIRQGLESIGTEMEVADAKEHGIPVFTKLRQIDEWFDALDKEEPK